MADANITRCVFLTFSSANFPSQVICQRKKLRTQQILEQRFSSKSCRICFFGLHSILIKFDLAARLWCRTASLLFSKITSWKICKLHQSEMGNFYCQEIVGELGGVKNSFVGVIKTFMKFKMINISFNVQDCHFLVG